MNNWPNFIWSKDVEEALNRLQIAIAQAAKSLPRLEQEARTLGKWGWTIPIWGTSAQLSWIVREFDQFTIDEYFLDTYRETESAQRKVLFRSLLDNPEMSRWLPLIEQCISAYEREQYLVVVPSLLTVLEGILAAATRRMQAKLDAKMATAQQTNSTDAGVTRLGWISIHAFVTELFSNSHFAGTRPLRINRNWILHGRDIPDRKYVLGAQ